MRISDWSSDVCSSDLLSYRFTIGVGEMLGFLGQGTLLLIPKRLFGRECTFPVSLERPGDQAVIRVDRFVTTAHERLLVAAAFHPQLPLTRHMLTFEFALLVPLNAHHYCSTPHRQ